MLPEYMEPENMQVRYVKREGLLVLQQYRGYFVVGNYGYGGGWYDVETEDE